MAGRRKVSQSISVPAPIGGWNMRDPIANMPVTDAVVMDNVFPDTAYCSLRKGYSAASPVVGKIDTVMEWAGPAESHLIVAASASAPVVYRIESTATASAQLTGLSNKRLQNTMFGTPAGSFLYIVNGENLPRFYNGTVWATSSLTGSMTGNGGTFKYVMAHQQRLFFAEANSLDVWYLPVNQIHGTCSRLPLGSLARKGGRIVAIGSWTLDGGSGMDDQAVFVTSEGEVFIYQGTDPASADTWALVGVYSIGRPIGDRSLVKLAGDLIVTCEDGAFPLSKALISSQAAPSVALTDKIRQAFKDAADFSRNAFGWQATLYPRGKMLVFNVPTNEDQESAQFVMNTLTGAWCKFLGLNAFSWGLFEGNLYFGGLDRLYIADYGYSDNGLPIQSDMLPAFNYFGSPGQQKHFKLARPVFLAGTNLTPALAMCTDFQIRSPSSTPSYSAGGSGPEWDAVFWDESDWGGSSIVYKAWQSAPGIGISGSLRIVTAASGAAVSIASIDYLFETGGTL